MWRYLCGKLTAAANMRCSEETICQQLQDNLAVLPRHWQSHLRFLRSIKDNIADENILEKGQYLSRMAPRGSRIIILTY